MDPVYLKIWDEARPLYNVGRAMDIPHIDWMMNASEKIASSNGLDETILLPLVILHDVGYSAVPQENPFQIDIRKLHMKEGARLAGEILLRIGYSEEKSKRIVYYVSIHDEWAIGNNLIYSKDRILGIFNDLDFMWMATPIGFEAVQKIRQCSVTDMVAFLKTNEKLTNRPFCSPATANMFWKYISEREIEIAQNNIQSNPRTPQCLEK